MKRIASLIMGLTLGATALQAKTLVVYYSFTNNCRTIAKDVKNQLADADLLEVQPAEEGLDYAANNYAIGSALISAIRNRPDDAASYPAIKAVDVDLKKYGEVVIVTPLWWSNMAAPMQTFLFQNGSKMEGKHIGLIVSSASSGISSVVKDAKRLVPKGQFYADNLWIRSAQTASCHQLVADWIKKMGVGSTATALEDVKATDASRPSIRVSYKLLQVKGEFDTIRLFDASGKLLLSSSERIVDLSRLSADVCIVQVSNGKSVESCKLIIR